MATPFPRHPAAVLVFASLVACSTGEDAAFSFALVGDNPYGDDYVPRFEALIDHVNQQPELAWVIHLGDAKGTEPCSDELLRSRFELFQRFAFPFLFTPGDNDWYDCAQGRMGPFDVYDRLAYVRRVFFPDPARATGTGSLTLDPQSADADYAEFVENARWVRGGVVFATVHLVGLGNPPTDTAVARRRMDAALTWIGRAFEVADEQGARGVFLATQVDPWQASGLPVVLDLILSCPQCLAPLAGMERLYPALVEHTVDFGRPVVLAVGDTHIFRVDKPLIDPDTRLLIENFTRVETFGHPDVHWVRVSVDPATPEVFSFTQQIVPANVRRDSVPGGR